MPQQLWFLNTVQQRCSLQAANGPQDPQPRPSVAVANNFDLASHAAEISNQFGIYSLHPSRYHLHEMTELRNCINPLRASSNGLDIYHLTSKIVLWSFSRPKVSSHCTFIRNVSKTKVPISVENPNDYRWILCDNCDRWFHTKSVGKDNRTDHKIKEEDWTWSFC